MPESGGGANASNETGAGSSTGVSESSDHPAQPPTMRIEGYTDHIKASRNQRIIMFQLGAVLQFMVNDDESNEKIRLQFVADLKLVVFNMDAWHDIQTVIYDACNTYPVSSFILSLGYKPTNRE